MKKTQRLLALLLALLCPLPVAAARVSTAIPVSVRTDGAAADAVYTVELTPLDAAPAPVQRALTVKNGGTVYFTGFAFDEPGDYRYLVAERSGGAAHTTYDTHSYTVTVRVTGRPDGGLAAGDRPGVDGYLFLLLVLHQKDLHPPFRRLRRTHRDAEIPLVHLPVADLLVDDPQRLGVLGGELLLGDLGLLGALLGVIGAEERIVQSEVDDQDKGEHHKGERLEAQAHDSADGAGDGPGQGVHKAVHAQEVDKDLEDPDVGDRGKDKRDKEDGLSTMGAANSSGSLTAKQTGTMAALPTARIS